MGVYKLLLKYDNLKFSKLNNMFVSSYVIQVILQVMQQLLHAFLLPKTTMKALMGGTGMVVLTTSNLSVKRHLP